MSATYQDVVTAWVVLLQEAPSPYTPPTDFNTLLPRAIEYAENRIYRKLIFLAERKTNSTLTFTAGSRTLNIATLSPQALVVEGVAAILPAGDVPAAGTRAQYFVSSLDTIDSVWPQESVTAAPTAVDFPSWAMKDNVTIVVQPTPDQNYTVELTAIFPPTSLSSSNTSTYLTLVYPELFIAAGMVYWTGYQRDYGASSDDPQFAVSWESQYLKLEAEAEAEERRRRGLASVDGNDARQPSAPAQPSGRPSQ